MSMLFSLIVPLIWFHYVLLGLVPLRLGCRPCCQALCAMEQTYNVRKCASIRVDADGKGRDNGLVSRKLALAHHLLISFAVISMLPLVG